jgi:alanyl-tRNA synthetase
MALPKELTAKIKALLKPDAELPPELEAGNFFESDDALAAFVAKKTGSKVSEAERKAQLAAKEAREAALAEVFEKMGVKDAEQIEEIKAKLAAAEGTLTEAEKLKGENAKLAKEFKKLQDSNAELAGFKVTVTKRQALDPHLSRIHSEMRDLVTDTLLPKLVIDEKGTVTAPEGKAIDAYLDEMIKAKPILKAPDYKSGAGTGPGEKKPNGGAGNGNGTGNGTEPKKYTSLAQAIADQATQIAAAQAAGP